MGSRKHLVALFAIGVWLACAGSASAAFPNFSDCPTRVTDVIACINVVNTGGFLNIKGFNVPLSGASLEIRGGLKNNEADPGNPIFVAPTGTSGLFSRAFPVPGGLLGIEFPIPGNSVLAITELAGPSSSIRINVPTQSITMPIQVRLVNVLLGMDCHIGSTSSPVLLHLTTGTTSPPGPNRPITGRIGTISIEEGIGMFRGNVDVDNAFAVPGASSCGLGLGLINAIVNAKLRLPSAAGNNTTEVDNDAALRFL